MKNQQTIKRGAVRAAPVGLADLCTRQPKRHILEAIFALAAIGLMLVPCTAEAAKTLTVLNNLDHGAGSLRDAIKQADGGDTIVFDSSLNGQTITLTSGALAISTSLDIQGPGAHLLAISGNNQSRVFDLSQNLDKPTVAVTIAGLTIRDGLSSSGAGGGIFSRGSTVTLINDVLSNNIANGASDADHAARGGAVATLEGGTLIVSGCEFNGNQALATGTGNGFGGAIYLIGDSKPVTATVSDSVFSYNLAQGGVGGNAKNGILFAGLGVGGAIMSDVGVTLSINDCTLSRNKAQGGSNIEAKPYTKLVGAACGGGLLAAGDVTTVIRSQFSENTAEGGIDNSGVYEVGNGIGGGLSTGSVFGRGESITVNGCTFMNNKALGGSGNLGGARTGGGFGGGLSDSPGAFFTASPFDFAGGMPLTVGSSSFIGNQALGGDGGTGQSGGDGLGGGVFNDAGSASPVNLSNCMLSGNQAAGGAGASGGNGFGGGLYDDGTSILAVIGSTVTANQATGGQGSPDGVGYGGGFYIDLDAFLSLDADTLLHTENNEPNDISGLYELFP